MLTSNTQPPPLEPTYLLVNPLPKHFVEIQELCRKVYPFSKPWSIEQLESHRSYFPDGQLIVIEKNSGKVVGLAFSLIIDWNDYSPQDNWQDFTSGGYFHNHNPKKGKTLYGAEVMVDPEYRGQGIGRLLYEGRQQIVEDYELKRIRAGARIRGYSKFKDKMTPHEYVCAVVEGKIYDPTLSFQLGRGFKVIDVAPNYLFNDPESLGFAAVIEWLNPATANERDLKKQQSVINAFLNEERFVPQHLPKELRRLVRKSSTALGQAIVDIEGKAILKKVEFYREQLKSIRHRKNNKEILDRLLKRLSQEDPDDLKKIAHAFSLHLEIVNVCEAAYRTWRQNKKSPLVGAKSKLELTYVLTAHPTEARSKNTVEILDHLQRMLVDGVHNNFYFNEIAILTEIRRLWMQPFFKKNKPSVIDEAEYIFSQIFAEDIFDFLLQDKRGYEIKLRTWVGGDKDGHPGVDKTVMLQCLQSSRNYLIESTKNKIHTVIQNLGELLDENKALKTDIDHLKSFYSSIEKFKVIAPGDGTKIKAWSMKFKAFLKKANPFTRQHEKVILLNRSLEIFPAFVLPIELREDASLIQAALIDPKSKIREMLAEISKVSGALDSTCYARGLVISNCESDTDLINAGKLIDISCKNSKLPIIPLFESEDALIAAKPILKKWLKSAKHHELVERHWSKRLEVMLGYSDSAKQTGALPSRLLIAKAMDDLDKFIRSKRLKPVFFHGSGGSVARGGGSLKEQISWWSPSAIDHPKMTVQGEMIQRLFASKEILNSQCAHLTNESLRRKVRKPDLQRSEVLDKFAGIVKSEYQNLTQDGPTLSGLLNATPYRYLDLLKLGSRPSKRPSDMVSVKSLRAIPWVLCWTQTRILLPSWWGVGAAWSQLSPEEKTELKSLFAKDPFFSSFVKTLAFTLSKVEIDIWEVYLKASGHQDKFLNISKEYQKALQFVRDLSGERSLLWYRPWLEESIRLRSVHISLLNLIQLLAMERGDELLLRETIVGIACGMLTTG